MAYRNLALVAEGASVTASSYQSIYVPGRIIDLDDTNYWASASYPVAGAYFTVDLGADHTCDHVYLLQRGTTLNFATSVKIERSVNGVDWSTVGTYACTLQGEDLTFLESVGRYWRFTAMLGGSQWWGIQTCRILGDEYYDPGAGRYYDWLTNNWPLIGAQIAYATTALGIDWEVESPEYRLLKVCAILGVQIEDAIAAIAAGGGGTGDHVPSNAELAALITNLDGDLQSALTVLAADHDNTRDEINQNTNSKVITLQGDLASLQTHVDDSVYARGTDVIGVIQSESSEVQANDNANTSGLLGTTNAARDSVLSDAATKHAAITQTVTSGLSQQTTDLAGTLGTTHDAILAAVQAIPNYSLTLQAILDALSVEVSGGNQWPGAGNVQLGLSQQVTGPALITFTMDGCLVTVEGVPNGQSHQTANGCTRYKGLGWLAFQTDSGDFEEIQQLHLSTQLCRPRDMLQASAVAVYCKPGATLTVQTYTIT